MLCNIYLKDYYFVINAQNWTSLTFIMKTQSPFMYGNTGFKRCFELGCQVFVSISGMRVYHILSSFSFFDRSINWVISVVYI